MGKALSLIVEIGAIAALGVFTFGVGSALAAGATLGSSIGFGIGAITTVTGLSAAGAGALALSGVAAVFSILQKAPKPATTSTALKSATPPRVSAYGRVRLHWAYIYFGVADDGWAVDVGVFHEGKLDGVEIRYIGDKVIKLISGNYVAKGNAGEWGDNCVKIGERLGLPTETYFSEVAAKIPSWNIYHRGDGCATGFMLSKNVKTENYQTVFPYGGPNQQVYNIVARAQCVFDWRDPSQSVDDDTTWKWSENAILHLAHYLLVRMNRTWSLHFVPTLDYWTAAANDADVLMPLKSFQTVTTADDSVDSNHSILVASTNGLVAGMSITITANDGTDNSDTIVVNSVSGLQINLASEVTHFYPLGSGVTWTATDAHPIYEPRYRSCVAHQHTDAHKDVLAHLIACSDAYLTPRRDGALVVYSGRYVPPTVTIGPDEIISYSLQDYVAEEDAINTIKITYISGNHGYNAVDTDDWTDEDDVEARGKVLSDSLENQVPTHSQARRLAKRAMVKINAPYRGTCTLNAAGRSIIGERYINLQLIEAGATLFEGPVEISKTTRILKTGGVSFDWLQADPNIDAWEPATEEGNPAPIGTSVPLQPLDAPVITNAVADYSAVSDDGTGVRIVITVAGLNRDDVIWYARWRVQGAAVWNENQYTDVDPSASVSLITGFVPTGKIIEIEAAQKTGDGRLSEYSSPSTIVNTSTSTTPPDPAAKPTLVSWGASLNMQVAPIPRATTYRWRFYADDGTTLIATHNTPDRTISYSSSIAASDGIRRSYVVDVAGINSAGAGTSAASAVISKPAPAAVTGVVATGGASGGEVDFTPITTGDIAGYYVAAATVANFDPMTQGFAIVAGGSPAYLQNLAAGTFYVKVAAYDSWTSAPNFVNFSDEKSFVVTTGGGGTGGGGGGGGGGVSGGGGKLVSNY